MSKTTVEVIFKDGEVVHENFQAVTKKVGEDFRHALLKCREGECEGECHVSKGECAKRTCECHLLLIVGMNRNLVVTRIFVEDAKVTRSY